MKKLTSIALIVLVQALLFAVGTFAATTVTPPHYDEATGLVCSTCHTAQLTIDRISTGYNNVCQNCHRPGDPAAGGKPITLADAADPFGSHSSAGISKIYQTSHRWDGSATNPAAGALPAIQAQMTTNGLRTRTGGQLACVSCHNQHSNANGAFLRMANDQDQMCLDCHRSRNTTDQAKGTHPVGIPYDGSKAGFKAIPANPLNSSADLNNYLKNGAVSCSTCHGVHFTDSRSSTIDGSAHFANLSSGDGNLLRVSSYAATAADENICTNCHDGKKNHNLREKDGKPAAQCIHCHSGHVDFDANATGAETTPNVYLVRRYLQYSAGGRVNKRIVYNSMTTKNFYSAAGGGVCQSCHNPPANHLSGSSVEPGHAGCASCHSHNEVSGSFSIGAGGCTNCHGYPPSSNSSGGPTGAASGYTRKDESTTPHATHASSPYLFACTQCHNGNSHNTGTFTDVFSDKTGILAGATAAYTPGTFSCSTVYCHSAGQGAGGSALAAGDYSSPTWSKTLLSCGNCHKNMKADATATGSHVQHAQSAAIACAVCHAGYTDTSVDYASHVNNLINLSFSGAATGTIYSQGTAHAPANGYGACATSVCHGQGAVTWGSSYVSGTSFPYSINQCDKCHAGTAAAPFYSTATLSKVTATSDPKVGAHTSHLTAAHSLTAALVCSDCHGTVASLSAANHMNGATDFVFSALAKTGALNPAYSNGQCANTYCHGTTLAGGSNKTPLWTDTIAGCDTCHGFPPATIRNGGIHPDTVGSACNSCHTNVNSTNDGFTAPGRALHINGVVDVSVGSCNSCHGYPPTAPGFTGTQNNWSSSRTENYPGGGGAHTVNNHVSKLAKPADGFTQCTKCHAAADHRMFPVTFNPSSNIKVSVNPNLRFESTKQARYTSNRLDGAAHRAGTCTNISCHNGATPRWDQR